MNYISIKIDPFHRETGFLNHFNETHIKKMRFLPLKLKELNCQLWNYHTVIDVK